MGNQYLQIVVYLGISCFVWQEMKLMFPGAQRMNRGNHEVKNLVHACKSNNVTDLVIVHETRGQPGMGFCAVSCFVYNVAHLLIFTLLLYL